MVCKEKMAWTAPGEKNDCAISFDGLKQESVVEVPGCKHVFQRRWISSGWLHATMVFVSCILSVTETINTSIRSDAPLSHSGTVQGTIANGIMWFATFRAVEVVFFLNS